jgi:type IV secretory pathway VirB6-like protein
MNNNFLTIIGAAITSMYSSQAGFFLATGMSIFWSLVVIKIFLLGVDSFIGCLKEDRFVKEVGMVLITGTLMMFYASPLPGVGVSFPHVIIDEAKSLSDRLEAGSTNLAHAKLNQAVAQTEQPGSGFFPTLGGMIQVAWYMVIVTLIGLERLVLVGVLAISYIAIGVIVLVGPMFVPWVLFPGLEYLAWNWLNAFLQYCFYQVVAGAVVFLNSKILEGFFTGHPLPWSLNDLPTIAIELLAVVGISIYVITWVPTIAASIMAGHSGSSFVNTRGV